MTVQTEDEAAAERRLAYLADCEPRRAWNASHPWVIVHVPTGEKIPTPRVVGGAGEQAGTWYMGYGHRLKRDAARALDELRRPAEEFLAS